MDKKDFGHLVATLRKEFRNEFDEPMTQSDLAELARIPLITLQKIEQGRQVNIKSFYLLNLAEALHLNSHSAQTFFMSSLNIESFQLGKPTTAPQQVLAELIQVLSNLQNPAFIQDDFGDIIALNQIGMAVYNLQLEQMHAPNLLTQYNFNRFYFSPEFEDLRKMMGMVKTEYLQRAVMLYKRRTLKVRNHWYFKQLIPELNRYPIFREYWQSQYFLDEDVYAQYKILPLNHPTLGQLKFFSSPNLAATKAGDLYLFCLQPMDAHTAQVCLQLYRKYAQHPIHLASWPKPPTPTASLIK